ncbi:MAG: PDZ domain-containing protein [Gemmataceae bacterium]
MNHLVRTGGVTTLAVLGLFLVTLELSAQTPKTKTTKKEKPKEVLAKLPASWVKSMNWRSIGPANMSGRITALSVYEADPTIFYAASAGGGLLKTTNNGTSFVHQFDHEETVSLGDVCVAPSDPNVVWVGTGENNPRNSVSYGNGVYKSTDGGKTWKHMGLEKTFQIGKILVHPTNPDIVYVGALGRLYGPNPERGLYKTTDGGKTWKKVLYKDENTGVIDMRMHPRDPDTLIVALWERKRDGFDSFLLKKLPDGIDTYDPVVRWGKNAGLYKTSNGGTTFRKLTKGLPTSQLGRIGLDWYRMNPNVLYAVVSCEKLGKGTPPPPRPYLGVRGRTDEKGAQIFVMIKSPADKVGLETRDIVQKYNDKTIKTYDDLRAEIKNSKIGDTVTLEVLRDSEVKKFEVKLTKAPGPGERKGVGGPGGATKNRPYAAYYGGQKENVQHQQGPDAHEYGGIFRSDDAGESWKRVNSFNPRPMYFSQIRVDPSDDQKVYILGIRLWRSVDGGNTFKSDRSRGIHADGHALWIDPRDGRHAIIGNDGGIYSTYDAMKNWKHHNYMAMGQFYHVTVDNKQPYNVYGGLQDNGSWGGPSQSLRGGLINADWLSIGGGDGFVCRVDPTNPDVVYYESQNGRIRRRNLKTGESGTVSPSSPKKKGAPRYRFNWKTPFILSHHNGKIVYCAGNYVFRSVNRGKNQLKISPEITLTKRGSATALAESALDRLVLWVGTDDGALWVTKDGGAKWTNVTKKVGLKDPRWVSTIEASRFEAGRAYVAFDAHRSDDDNPYLYVTEDYGQTWKPITSNLPRGSTRCLREDVKNPNLLYTGTEFGLYASTDRGETWTKLNNNLPTVAIHEIAVHPTAGEIVAATHGRSLWILDVTALRQMTGEVIKKKAHLYTPQKVTRWIRKPTRGRHQPRFVGSNPPSSAQIFYSLNDEAKKVEATIYNIEGKELATLKGSGKAGLNKIAWNMLTTPKKKKTGKGESSSSSGGFRFTRRTRVPNGVYRIVLNVDGQELTTVLRIEPDPNFPRTTVVAEEELDEELLEQIRE